MTVEWMYLFPSVFPEGFSIGCTVRLLQCLYKPITTFIFRLLSGLLSLSALDQLQLLGCQLSRCVLADAYSSEIRTLSLYSFILNLNKLASIFVFFHAHFSSLCALISPICNVVNLCVIGTCL